MGEIRALVGTTDLERSSAFFRNLFGFPVAEQWDDADGRGTLFRAGDRGVIEVIEGSPGHPAEPPRGVRVVVEVSDVDRLHQRVREAGVEIVEPPTDRPWGHRTFEIRDPNGLLIVLFAVLPYAESAAARR